MNASCGVMIWPKLTTLAGARADRFVLSAAPSPGVCSTVIALTAKERPARVMLLYSCSQETP
jgi:hypothetical protein